MFSVLMEPSGGGPGAGHTSGGGVALEPSRPSGPDRFDGASAVAVAAGRAPTSAALARPREAAESAPCMASLGAAAARPMPLRWRSGGPDRTGEVSGPATADRAAIRPPRADGSRRVQRLGAVR